MDRAMVLKGCGFVTEIEVHRSKRPITTIISYMLKILAHCKAVPFLILSSFFSYPSGACAQTVVSSTTGYQVNISIVPIALVVHTNPCTWGYNYDVKMSYTITFTGTAPPASMYTLQGTVGCGSSSLFFNLPNGPSSGTVTSTGNAWRSVGDCATATLATLGCNQIKIQINGPGINTQTVMIPFSTLPISLVRFDAQDQRNGVHLDWATASEQDNAYFTVERSEDADTFTAVLQLAGAGNSSQMLSYSAVDPAPMPGLSYYRLRQTDINGTTTTSPTVVVRRQLQPTSFQVYPNPSDSPTVELSVNTLGGELEIRSMNGQLIYTGPVLSHTLNLPLMDSGTYMLTVRDPNTGMSQHSKLVRL